MSAMFSTVGGGVREVGGEGLLQGASRTTNCGGLGDFTRVSLLLLGGFM